MLLLGGFVELPGKDIERSEKKMKIRVNFIDSKGFLHFETGKSKKSILQLIKRLATGTDAYWHSKGEVTISQQYVKR